MKISLCSILWATNLGIMSDQSYLTNTLEMEEISRLPFLVSVRLVKAIWQERSKDEPVMVIMGNPTMPRIF